MTRQEDSMMEYQSKNKVIKPTMWYGRLAGGTRDAEVDYIRSLLTTEIWRERNAARTNAALPQPHKSIVGRVKDAVRRRLLRFWLAHRDSLIRWIMYRIPDRWIIWYGRKQGSLRNRMLAAFKKEGIRDDDIGWVDPEWNNPMDLYTEARAARRGERIFPITLDRADEVLNGFDYQQWREYRERFLKK
jgi:hypothetical protein